MVAHGVLLIALGGGRVGRLGAIAGCGVANDALWHPGDIMRRFLSKDVCNCAVTWVQEPLGKRSCTCTASYPAGHMVGWGGGHGCDVCLCSLGRSSASKLVSGCILRDSCKRMCLLFL
jgi:hypothetical protein